MKPTQEIFDEACEKGCLDLVKVCIEEGADIHDNSNYALRWSIIENHYNVVKYLLENGADPYDTLWNDLDSFQVVNSFTDEEIIELLKQYKRQSMKIKDFKDIELDGIDTKDYPDFVDAYIINATYKNREATEEELDWLNDQKEFVYE